MRIALTGPSSLTAYDRVEIDRYLRVLVGNGSQIHIFAHNSIEIEVFRFFMKQENESFIPLLHIHTLRDLSELEIKYQRSIDFLVEHGANHRSFNVGKEGFSKEGKLLRKVAIEKWEKILVECDSVVLFYDGHHTKLFVPIDVALDIHVKPLVYQLPGNDLAKHELPASEKMEIRKKEVI